MCFDPERKRRQGYACNFSREVIRPDLTLIYVSEMGATLARMLVRKFNEDSSSAATASAKRMETHFKVSMLVTKRFRSMRSNRLTVICLLFHVFTLLASICGQRLRFSIIDPFLGEYKTSHFRFSPCAEQAVNI
jgi:hypothetical protein